MTQAMHLYTIRLLLSLIPPIMQVPSREHDMCPEDALTLFINDIPVLGLIGSKHLIEKDEPYSIDSDAQLVCKYLKAYKIGGRRGIDKLYRERKCSLVNNKERCMYVFWLHYSLNPAISPLPGQVAGLGHYCYPQQTINWFCFK